MKREVKYQTIELLCIFVITLLFNLMCITLNMDEVWNYGFAYNIGNGLIPYRDFNMVITPLFPMLGALFTRIFGYSILIYHIFNALMCTIIFNYMKKYNNKSYYISYAIFLFFSLPSYNVFCLLLLYILIHLEDKKTDDYLIGIVLGLTFLTKQNIGIYLCIPTLFIKNKKSIIKRIIGFIIPNILLIIYLLHNHALYNFIDYVFLGINSFAKNNAVNYKSTILILIISLIYLIYEYIKTKNRNIIYLICFFGMAYPIFDPIHVMIPFVIMFNHFLNKINLNKKIIMVTFVIFITSIFTYNMIINNNGDYNYPNSTNTFKYRKINKEVEDSINTVTKYFKNTTNKVFIIDPYAYLIKLNSGTRIDKYDLLNNGNLGSGGANKIIIEITDYCEHNKCNLLLYKPDVIATGYAQYNKEIYAYVMDNYQETDDLLNLTIYSNY